MSTTSYAWLADVVVVLHLGFILFVMLGGLLVLRWPWLAYVHLPAVVWGVLVEWMGWICPLTPLENRLRVQAGEWAYQQSFVAEYILPIVYPADLTRPIQWLLGGLVLVLNAGIYLWLLRRRR